MNTEKTQEELFEEILAQPELEAPNELEAVVEEGFPEIDEETKEAIANMISAKMPSPEEIAQRQRFAQHNAIIKEKREKELARRKERRKIVGRRPNKKRKRK